MDTSTDNFDDLGIVARTVWGEARNQGPDGWAAVTWVIKNRADHPGWWGRSIREVCLRPQQFSSWNFGDSNRQQMLELDDNDQLLHLIRGVVERVFSNDIPDPTDGATYYHTRAVHPSWDQNMTKTASVGAHDFYKEAV